MKKRMSLLPLMLLLAFLFTGCAKGVAKPDTPVNPSSVYPLTLVDHTGRTVVINAEPQRYVSLLPNLTEILYALGLGDRVSGVTKYCYFPPEAQDVEKIGDAFSPNIEKVLFLGPDMVLSGKGSKLDEVLPVLEENGITVAVFDPKTMDGIEDVILQIAYLAQVEQRGQDLVAEIQAARRDIGESVARQNLPRPGVFVMIDTDTLFTVGEGEFLSEMIEVAGGKNVASALGKGYLQISEEKLFELDPDIIIATYPMRDALLARSGWQGLKAVQSGRVYDVDGDVVSRPGPRVAQGLEELFRAFYE
jgi:iron complex transport system substrate-binding protein